jgi:hypothetical protein
MEQLFPKTKFDATLRLIVGVTLIGWLLVYGLVYRARYPDKLVVLYNEPWWRLLLVGLVVLSAFWCPRVSALFALVVLLYFSDMDTLTSK